jgi:hypothetical protein
MFNVLRYLGDKAAVFPKDFAPRVELDKLIKQQGWDKK